MIVFLTTLKKSEWRQNKKKMQFRVGVHTAILQVEQNHTRNWKLENKHL